DAELHDRRPARRVTQLGVVREVARDDDLVIARHLHHLPIWVPLPARMAWAGRGKVPLSGRLCSLATDDDLEPQDLVREMQRSLELGDDARVRRELGDHVVALVLTI